MFLIFIRKVCYWRICRSAQFGGIRVSRQNLQRAFFLAQEQFREELMMMKFCSSVVVCSKAIDKSHLPQMQMFTTFPCESITIFLVRLVLSIHLSMLVKAEK
jgi:hypothetical protein